MLAKAILREPWAEHAAARPADRPGDRLRPRSAGRRRAGGRAARHLQRLRRHRPALRRRQRPGQRLHRLRDAAAGLALPAAGPQFPVLLASDLIYEVRNVAPLVALIQKVLHPDGLCLLTDQDRVPSHVLRDTLAAEGLPFTTQVMRAGEPGGRRAQGDAVPDPEAGGRRRVNGSWRRVHLKTLRGASDRAAAARGRSTSLPLRVAAADRQGGRRGSRRRRHRRSRPPSPAPGRDCRR